MCEQIRSENYQLFASLGNVNLSVNTAADRLRLDSQSSSNSLYRNPCHGQPHLFRYASFPQTKPTLAAHSARPTSGIVSPNAAVKKEKVINLTPRCEYSSHCLVGFNRPHLEAIVSEKGRRYLAQCHWDVWQAWPHPRARQLIQQELNAL